MRLVNGSKKSKAQRNKKNIDVVPILFFKWHLLMSFSIQFCLEKVMDQKCRKAQLVLIFLDIAAVSLESTGRIFLIRVFFSASSFVKAHRSFHREADRSKMPKKIVFQLVIKVPDSPIHFPPEVSCFLDFFDLSQAAASFVS